MKFAKAANLTLIDFDPKWDDVPQVIGIVKDKLIKDGGIHNRQLIVDANYYYIADFFKFEKKNHN